MAASIPAAAAILETTLDGLKQAKRVGCPGFRANGSVNLSEVRQWLASDEGKKAMKDIGKKASLECRRLEAQCEKLEFQLEIERGDYTANDSIRRDMLRIGAAMRSSLQRLRSDVPQWEGLPAADLDRRAADVIDRICADLHDETSRLYA